MTKEELEKIEEAARWQENYDKQLKDIKKLHKACHKWFMRWREAKKDALYFDSSLQKQIEATLKLQQENAELKRIVKMVAMINKGIYTNEGIKAIYAEAEQFLNSEGK